jgi:hypothetical protein
MDIFIKNKIEKFNSFFISILLYFYIVTSFLGIYAPSERSYSFYFAFFFVLLKIVNIYFSKKIYFFNKVVIAILILFFYLLFLDLFFFISISKNYFFTLACNIFMFTMILDEFKKNIKLRDNSLLLLLFTSSLISLLVNNNFFSLTLPGGRTTFLHLNHNTFSFILLFPLFLFVVFIIGQKQTSNKIMNYFLIFLYIFIFINLLNSIINSGSRFPVYIIFLFYLLLFVMCYFWKLNSFKIFFIVTSFAYFLYEVIKSNILFPRIFEKNLTLDGEPYHIGLLLDRMSSGRSTFITDVINTTKGHEVLGVGTSNLFFLRNSSMPHNIFFEIYGSGGLIGVILLFIIAFLLCLDVYLEKSNSNKFSLIVATALFFSMSLYINVLFEKIWWLILCFILSTLGSQTYFTSFKIIKKKSIFRQIFNYII